MVIPADIEYILAQCLKDICPAYPTPVPMDLNAPAITITRTGGSRASVVVDTHLVSIDVYGDNYGDATDTAGQAVGAICELYGEVAQGTQLGAVNVLTLPYANPDPNHPTLARVTFTASLVAKAVIK